MKGKLLKTNLDRMNVKQFTLIGIISGAIVGLFIVGAALTDSPFIYDYGDSTTCPYDAYDNSNFSLSSCQNLYKDYTSDGEIWYWVGRMSQLSKLNQILVVYLLPYKTTADSSKFSLNFKLWVRARKSEYGTNNLLLNGESIDRTIECQDEERGSSCNRVSIALVPYLRYEEYDFFISVTDFSTNQKELNGMIFRFVTIEPHYTKIIMSIKTTCLILSIVLAIYYRKQMKMFEHLPIPVDQRFVLRLASVLILFNDPLHLFGIYFPSIAFTAIYGIFLCSFFSLILFYWLFSCQRIPELDDYKTEVFTLGKKAYFIVFGVFSYIFYIYTILEIKDNSYYWSLSNTLVIFYLIMGTLLAMFVLWMGYSVVMAWRRMPPGFFRKRVLLGMNIVGVLFTISVIAASVFQTYNMAGGAYIFFFGYFNVYVWVLLILHIPTKEGVKNLTEMLEQIKSIDPEELPRDAPVKVSDIELEPRNADQTKD